MASDEATSVCLQFPSSPGVTQKLYKALSCNAHTFLFLGCRYASSYSWGGGGGCGVGGEVLFTLQIWCCVGLFRKDTQAYYLLQKAKPAVRVYEAEKLFCCVGSVIQQDFLDRCIAPHFVNDFSLSCCLHPSRGCYSFSQSHCPFGEAVHL